MDFFFSLYEIFYSMFSLYIMVLTNVEEDIYLLFDPIDWSSPIEMVSAAKPALGVFVLGVKKEVSIWSSWRNYGLASSTRRFGSLPMIIWVS